MDLNELLHRHQASVMRAGAAGDDAARAGHFAKVAEYAERVRQLRELRMMTDTPTPAVEPETIIYGTYAGDPSEPAAPKAVASWEGEGGALDPPETAELPEGVTSRLVREYRVGPYVYHDLDLALAEHLRQLSAADDDPPA